MANKRKGIVIIGGGQAGWQIAASLRGEGYDGPIRLICEEADLPYQRPPLSKAYLAGKAKAEALPIRPEAFYTQNAVELVLATPAAEIDRAAKRVRAGASVIDYDGLAITTGGHVRRLALAGADAPGVFYLRTRADADAIKADLTQAARVVVIGGGFIGLEVAASARALGRDVAVLEALPRLMARVLPPAMSDFFAALHRGHGVAIETGCDVTAIAGDGGRGCAVVTGDGRRHRADLVVIGIGIAPSIELAAAAGLACENGVLVDACARTADPAIVAAGDCANHPNPFAQGARIRLESVQNAIDQAKTAAASLLGRAQPYRAVPWFWSDQYDVKLQMAGLSAGHDRLVLRGDQSTGRFSSFYFRARQLIAVDSINRPADHVLGRRLIAAGASPTPEQAANSDFDLKGLLKPR